MNLEKSIKIGNRQLEEVFEILSELRSIEKKFKLEVALKNKFKNKRYLGSKDRRVISQICFGYYRWLGFFKDLHFYDQILLIMIFENIQHLPFTDFLYTKPDGLTLTKIDFKDFESLTISQKAGLLNQKSNLNLDIVNLFPNWLHTELPIGNKIEYILGTQNPAKTIIRKTNKYNNEDFPFEVTKHAMLQSCIIVNQRTDIINSELYKNGKIDIQDSGSQVICLAADPKQDDYWWDCCAGAGGKSLYMAQLMMNKGKILASDIRDHSLNEIKRRANLQNITILKIMNLDLSKKVQLTEKFDGILIDAPCSGSGTWRRHPADKWHFSKNELEDLNKLQFKILTNVAQHLKDDGILVYATCSIFTSENSAILNKFLDTHKNFKLEKFQNPYTKTIMNGMLQLIPNEFESDGMFIAKLKKSSL